MSPIRIIELIEVVLDSSIDIQRDVIFFDEIQDCPRALTSLKYFYEDMPELALICAGSLLGVVHSDSAFPVGKVSFLHLYPMSFMEFLIALGDTRSLKYVTDITKKDKIPLIIHNHLMEILKEYFIVGGRFSKLRSSIDWLTGAGLIIKVKISNSGELPFSAFTMENRFKLYLFDIGLLGALGGLPPPKSYLYAE